MNISHSALNTLIKNGVIKEERKTEYKKVFQADAYDRTGAFKPTGEQALALEMIRKERNKEIKRPVLLHGITGSGKTEVYMQAIAEVLKEGKQAIVLVPEISLAPQMLERFVSRFGERVTVTHSRLSAGERLDQWRRARAGEISVIIGPRSALFTPFQNLGIIVVDEIHDNSYISDITPKYDTCDIACKMAETAGALIIMGSATPDVIRYRRAEKGEFLLLELKERTGGGHLPRMHVVDMRLEMAEGNRSSFSIALQREIQKNLDDGEQTLLFLNRRGYSTFVSCRSCGKAMLCPECRIPYTYHERENALLCHYCGKKQEMPKVCPECGSKYIKFFGAGTQRIEEETKRLFPEARVLRLDIDAVAKKGSHFQILEAFRKGRADILIGTQMIAKGHDFPGVTLVGIMAADISLHSADFYGAERTFQLITQAGGRSGRTDARGRVYIQTYQPENYGIVFAKEQDYKGFYREEMRLRELMGYPPFGVFLAVLVSGENVETVKEAAESMKKLFEEEGGEAISVMGPIEAMQVWFRGEYRQRLLIQGKDEDELISLGRYAMEKLRDKYKGKVFFNLTLNPQNIV